MRSKVPSAVSIYTSPVHQALQSVQTSKHEGTMKAATSLCLFLLLTSLCFPGGEARAAAADCGYVAKEAMPCIPYVTGKQPRPAPACCAGLQQLARGAATTADRRAVCQCLETAARAFPGVQDRYFSRAPALCGVNVGFPVSLSTDCGKIN